MCVWMCMLVHVSMHVFTCICVNMCIRVHLHMHLILKESVHQDHNTI